MGDCWGPVAERLPSIGTIVSVFGVVRNDTVVSFEGSVGPRGGTITIHRNDYKRFRCTPGYPGVPAPCYFPQGNPQATHQGTPKTLIIVPPRGNRSTPGPQTSPKSHPRDPPENSTPKAHLPAQCIQGPLKPLNNFQARSDGRTVISHDDHVSARRRNDY